MNRGQNKKGFTIVELLIVIVVIGILAAITIVAYSNIQQRASNSSIISAARNTIVLIKGYKASYGNYPSLGAYCVTTDNACVNYTPSVVATDNTSWLSELRKIGTPSQTIPGVDSTHYGLYFDGYAPRTYNHDPIPGLLMFWLKGNNQPCQVQDVVINDPAPLAGETNAYMTSSNPWTSTGGGMTKCWVSV